VLVWLRDKLVLPFIFYVAPTLLGIEISNTESVQSASANEPIQEERSRDLYVSELDEGCFISANAKLIVQKIQENHLDFESVKVAKPSVPFAWIDLYDGRYVLSLLNNNEYLLDEESENGTPFQKYSGIYVVKAVYYSILQYSCEISTNDGHSIFQCRFDF
jgi:hypothetical protein